MSLSNDSGVNTPIQIVEYDIDQSLIPQPVGWRILVMPIKIQPTTKGGIVLPDQAKKAKEYLRFISKVVAMGPDCYMHDKFGESYKPWCSVGDWIAHGTYIGQNILVRDKNGERVTFKLINDDSVMSVIHDPASILIYE